MGNLEIVGLSKRLGGNVILDRISFSVAEGEFFVLLGPSGGGKSTLLRLICGLEQPDAGRILLGGREISGLRPRERNVGMVFQDYGLYPHMNVFQNIAYGLEARHVPRREIERRTLDAAEKLGLTLLLQRLVVDLSGGEQQRVALARALARDADVYLFDEPLSNLDPKLRARARGDILLVHREKHKPSLYVTHDQTEALAIGDRIGIIAHGRMQQIGRADELIGEPANLFVAGFVGTPPMNLLGGTVVRHGEGYAVSLAGLTVSLPARWHHALSGYARESVVLGIRPAAILPADSPGAEAVPADSVIAARVVEVEPLIGETVVTLELGRGLRLFALFPEATGSLAPGDTLRLAIDADELRLFDPESEEALNPQPA
ncbi:MAG: ABC transporter ATP-binding protein [Anaerolineae bacterium]|nr:ABC transporter ATP-binding protein [Anaerolineae bacterium]